MKMILSKNKKVAWLLGFSVSCFRFWFLGFFVSKFLGSKVYWLLDFKVSGFLGFRVSWFRGFKASWFQSFLVLGFNISKFERLNDPRLPSFHFMFLIDIDPISKIFKKLSDGSTGLFGARLFQNFLLLNFQHF